MASTLPTFEFSGFLPEGTLKDPFVRSSCSQCTVTSPWHCGRLSVYRQVPAYLDRLCGLVVRVPAYGSRGPGSIPGATRFSEK
jgi:hypothetical protein